MTNQPFASLADFRDIESLNYHRLAVEQLGHDPERVLRDLRRTSRDNARTPMQWSHGPAAGFTTGEPWIGVNPNHTWLNVEAQKGDPTSVLAHYRALIDLRHREPAVVDGDFTLLEPEHPRLWAFTRRLGADCLAVYANLSGERIAVDLPVGEVLLDNRPGEGTADGLSPWQAVVLRC